MPHGQAFHAHREAHAGQQDMEYTGQTLGKHGGWEAACLEGRLQEPVIH